MRRAPVRLILSDRLWRTLCARIPDARRCRGYLDHATRRAVEGMLWVIRTGAPWRELPMYFGRWNTVYKRYRRWALAGVWQSIYVALLGRHAATEGQVLLDSTIVRVHQHGSGGRGGAQHQAIGTSRDARTTKLHVALGDNDVLLCCEVTPGNGADICAAPALLRRLRHPAAVIADRAYDADAFVAQVQERGAKTAIPARRGR